MLAALLLLLPLVPQGGSELPRNDGWVTDLARLLSPEQERSLEALCDAYRVGTGHDVAVLTLPDLGGQPIERLALRIGREWKLGGESDDGALLLVAQAEHKIRIEVGGGLEGMLTDSISGRIIRDRIGPAFRSGDYYSGLRAGIEAIQAVLGGEPGAIGDDPAGLWAERVGVGVFFCMLLVLVLVARSQRRRLQSGRPFWVGPMQAGPRVWGAGGGGVQWSGGFGRSTNIGGGFRGFGGGGGFRGGGATGGW